MKWRPAPQETPEEREREEGEGDSVYAGVLPLLVVGYKRLARYREWVIKSNNAKNSHESRAKNV